MSMELMPELLRVMLLLFATLHGSITLAFVRIDF